MIICSKCKIKFKVYIEKISQNSTIVCPSCGESNPVGLLDLDKHDESLQLNDESDDIKSHKGFHFMLLSLKILTIFFILGLFNLSWLEGKSPSLARFYAAIGIKINKGLLLEESSVVVKLDEKGSKNLLVNIKVMNQAKKAELISDLVLTVYDKFNNPLALADLTPNQLIKANTSLLIEIKLPNLKEKSSSFSLYMNGKVVISNQKLPNAIQ
jgi:hypothetical protein